MTKKEVQERHIYEDKKFNQSLLISFSILLVLTISILLFYTYWCDLKFAYRQHALYGEEVSKELVCMCDNILLYHESSMNTFEKKTFYICSKKCYQHFTKHFQEVAFITDAFSGDTICKSDALIGLENRGKPQVVYFKNKETFNHFYQAGK